MVKLIGPVSLYYYKNLNAEISRNILLLGDYHDDKYFDEKCCNTYNIIKDTETMYYNNILIYNRFQLIEIMREIINIIDDNILPETLNI